MKKLSGLVIVISMIVLITGAVHIAGAQSGQTLSGEVLETMDSGGYTYAQIENNGKKTWVAVPKTKIAKGQTVAFEPGMPMKNFKSKTLNRTFDVIYFSGGITE